MVPLAEGPRVARAVREAEAHVVDDAVAVQSAMRLGRWDHPRMAPGAAAARGSAAVAREILGHPGRAHAAEEAFRLDALATTTRPVYDSYEKTLLELARAGGFSLLPLSMEKVNRIGGALRAAGYRSVANYLEHYRRMHLLAGGAWPTELAFCFKGARRAAVRGLGPSVRAAPFRASEIREQVASTQSCSTGAPRDYGAFVLVGVWWLLREIEASALTVASVEQEAGGGSLVALRLGVTKADIRGRGAVRAHRCVCALAGPWAAACPACSLKSVAQRRLAEGAGPSDPLFVAADGRSCCVKADTVALLRARFTTAGEGVIDGHSMRRTGAQLLTAAGVEPWFVEWFGRWGSSAVRAYVEDARAFAPQASSAAAVVASPGGSVHDGSAAAAELPVMRQELSELRRLVLEASGAQSRSAVPAVRAVVNAVGKTHIAFDVSLVGPPAGRVALCGWSLRAIDTRIVFLEELVGVARAALCRKCLGAAGRHGVDIEATDEPLGLEEQSEPSASPSATSGSEDP